MTAITTPICLLLLFLTTLDLSASPASSLSSGHVYNVGDSVPLFANIVGPLNNPSETYQYYELPFCHPGKKKVETGVQKRDSLNSENKTLICFRSQQEKDHLNVYNDLLPPRRSLPNTTCSYNKTKGEWNVATKQVIPKKETLGEVLNGDRLTNSLYDLKFQEDKFMEILCDKKLKRDDIAKFRDAVSNEYYYQMYYDELPLWGFIGKMEDESLTGDGKGPKYYIFSHVQFDALYSGNQVIEIRAFGYPNQAVDITDRTEINMRFTYSIFWNATSNEYGNRMNKYSRASLLPMQRKIHWFSFINSVVIIVLLMGLLILLFVRHLKNDLRKYSGGDEEQDKEVGWKYIHGDVFRCPPQMAFFCAFLGTGTQLLTIISFLFILAFFGVLYPYNRGGLSTSFVVFSILTSPVAGYSAASFYGQFTETGWERCILLTGSLFLGPLFVIVLLLNTVAMSNGATAALPFGTILVILIAYTVIAIPLIAIGGLIGYRSRSQFQAPSATKISPREIPSLTWYRRTTAQIFIGGLLPFSVIVLELHNLYATIWSYKIFTLPGILFITFFLLIILTSLLSIGLTYIQLTVEDHRWWWRSVLRGGSTAIFVLGYGIYYYSRSYMSGLMQLTFFFGYNLLFCYALFLMLGTIGFHASWIFIQHIYNAVKSE